MSLIDFLSPTLKSRQSVSLDIVIEGRGVDFGSCAGVLSSRALSNNNPVCLRCSSFLNVPWLFRNSSIESFHSRFTMFVLHGSEVSHSRTPCKTSPIFSPTSKRFSPFLVIIRKIRSGFSSFNPLNTSKKLVPCGNSLAITYRSYCLQEKKEADLFLWLFQKSRKQLFL